MILNVCSKRTASWSAFRGLYASNLFSRHTPLTNRSRPSTKPPFLDWFCVLRSGSGPGRRFGSASRRRKRPRNHTQDDEPPIPRWPAAASAMIVPFMFAAWGVSDWMFGNRTRGHNKELRQAFLAEQRSRHAPRNDDDFLSYLEAKPTLFYCVIRKDTGLAHCLPAVRLGDVVEVLEEGVGPDRAYNLCRLPAKDQQPSLSGDTYGWFPIRWLQKLDHYESTVREQLGNLSKHDPE